MKITKSVNIANSLFVIDEDAYNYLESYLNDISSRIEDERERLDIINDIESRCSEIFLENGISGCRVVDLNLIKHTISLIGSPDIFGEIKRENFKENIKPLHLRKRLLRDGDDKLLGGVCSGIAAYFGVDVIALRVVIFLFAFFVGTGVLVYLIAWIVIPKAKSNEELELLKEMKEKI